MSAATALVALEPLTRDSARDAARTELGRRQYLDAQPPLLLRLLGRGLRALGHLFDRAATALGNGLLARVLLLAVLALVAAVVLVRLGPLGDRRAARPVFDDGQVRSADEHRAAADVHAAQERYAEAVRERLRALVRELEARGVLDQRPARTAGEVARDGAAALPWLAEDLRQAARTFDEVWYGGRDADRGTYAVLVGVDERVRTARLVTA